MCTIEIDGVTYAVEMKLSPISKEQAEAQVKVYENLLTPAKWETGFAEQWNSWSIRREQILKKIRKKK